MEAQTLIDQATKLIDKLIDLSVDAGPLSDKEVFSFLCLWKRTSCYKSNSTELACILVLIRVWERGLLATSVDKSDVVKKASDLCNDLPSRVVDWGQLTSEEKDQLFSYYTRVKVTGNAAVELAIDILSKIH